MKKECSVVAKNHNLDKQRSFYTHEGIKMSDAEKYGQRWLGREELQW